MLQHLSLQKLLKSPMIKVSPLFLIVTFIVQNAAAVEPLEKRLQDFYSNTKEYYNRPVKKYDLAGNEISSNPFMIAIDTDKISKIKKHYRKEIGRGIRFDDGMKAPPLLDDQPGDLIDNKENIVNNIFQIEQLKLLEAKLDKQPWSADYWPIYKGVLGNRYLDPKFPYVLDWSKLYKYITKFPFLDIFKSADQIKIQRLATAEKYDLMVGDLQGNLTQNMWNEGKYYYDRYGKVETWMGICHGWAAAAIAVPRPRQSIKVLAYDGKTELTLNPSEIKGLISYLWANTPYATKFIGGRCDLKEVKKDEVGRPLAPECFDTNPATWHQVAVNQIAVNKRSFVIDVTADYEVWNQPMLGYKITYFNPQTKKEANSIAEAMVAKSDFLEDKFKKYRSEIATHFIGIDMQLQYIVEDSANDRTEDNESYDMIQSANYMYDLELDEKGNIIGGEWYQAQHPDFLWAPVVGVEPKTYEDQYLNLDEWDTTQPLPKKWKEAAQWGSQSGRVLSSIVKKINESAQ